MTDRTPWQRLVPEDKRELVRQAVQHDNLMYSLAAERLGTTRVAIAGVIDRARRSADPIAANSGLKNQKGVPNRNRTALNRAKATKKRPKQNFHKFVASPTIPLPIEPPARTDVWAALPGSSPVAIENHHDGCRWTIGLDRPFLYCNLPTKDGSVLCPAHHAISYKPVPVRQKTHAAR